MAKTECPECGESINATASSCPHCGAPADNIRRAAAGLETLVTLGDVVHGRGTIEDDSEHMQFNYVRMKKDVDDLYDAVRRSSTDHESEMIFKMIKKREKELLDMEIKMGFHEGFDQLSPKHQRKLRRELGLDD